MKQLSNILSMFAAIFANTFEISMVQNGSEPYLELERKRICASQTWAYEVLRRRTY